MNVIHYVCMPKNEEVPQDTPGQAARGVLSNPGILAILAEHGAAPEDVTLMHVQRRPIEPPEPDDPHELALRYQK